jgi:hypothetical protein|tara:strand:- start:215 stop:1036 length:822 start_codon:yes stop_codon:yes gene_type:complete
MKRIEVLNRIQEIYAKLEKNRLEPSEIEELVDLSNKLYERALILRYKVAEQRIFGKDEDQTTTEIANETDDLSEVSIQESDLPEVIDFSIFESVEEKILQEEVVEKSEPIIAEEPAPKKQETVELNFQDTAPKPEEAKVEIIAEPVAEVKAEVKAEPIVEAKEEVKPSPAGKTVTVEDWSAYFDKVLQDHSSSIQKHIDTLAGSFGLNERILYINELFNGVAETFSNAVLQMDKSADWNSCKKLMNDFANQENWDKESDTIGEFVLHIKRKHA